MPRAKLLTTAEAASTLLGWEGEAGRWRLHRLVIAREKATGNRIYIRLPRNKLGHEHKRLTKAILQKHLPELFLHTQDDQLAEVRSMFRQLEGKVQERVDNAVARQAEEQRRADRILESMLREWQAEQRAQHSQLTERVRALEEQLPPAPPANDVRAQASGPQRSK